MAQSGFTLARRGATPPDGRYPLAQAQMKPFYKRGIDQPAAGTQHLIHRCLSA
jgi:hypothetical protein